jgi:predicted MFS family arabinose efflux permease
MSCEAAAGVTSAGRQSLTFETGLLAFAMFMVVTTEFSVVGLLPALARDFDISLARAGWFVSAFAVASALLGPPLTMLAARCDPRRVLVASTTLFAVGNGLAAATQDPLVLLVVRIVQGGVLPMVASIAIVSATRLAGTGREGWASARVNRGVVATAVIGIPAVAITAERIGWPASCVDRVAVSGSAR